jgi:hypothetical protein
MSHFSFTRLPYDNCATIKKDCDNNASFNWMTDASITESKETCFEGASPFMHNPYKSVPANSIDIESDLRGQNIPLTKCPERKFNPDKAQKINTKVTDCKKNDLVPQYTRLNKSCNMFSGININRFDPLCEDLQEINKIHSNNYIGVNTRLQLKDTFPKK